MQGVPRGPDGGIDGRINEDKLGLDQIYIQAKRYADNSVGRPTVQSFVGAMTGGGCKKGVFVTSSSFTNEARAFAADLRDQKLVLIDGVTFAKLMIENDIGIQVKDVYRVAKVDHDFFSEDE
jgi:restriction system protein